MKTLGTLLILLISLLMIAGCTGQGGTPPSISPPATGSAPNSTPAQTQQPSAARGNVIFGRYAASSGGALFFASDNAVWRMQGGQTQKICDVPGGQVAEDLYAPDGDALYFTAILDKPDGKGNDRILYRLALNEANALPKEYERGFGPMMVTDGVMHVLQGGEIICIDSKDGAEMSCSKPGKLAQLVGAGSQGKRLYYCVFKRKDAGGTPYGESTLYRLTLEGLKAEAMGSVNKPKSDIITITRDLIYKRSQGPDKDSYRYTIIDSPMGSLSGGYLMKKSVIDAQLGSESLFRSGEGLYLLVIGKSGESEMTLSCYGLSESEPTKLWDTAFTAPVIAVDYDEQSGKIAVLCEGKAQKTYMLFSVDAGSGTTSQAYTGSFVDQNAQLRLTTLAGMVLVFSSKGEDRPNPTLLYAASLSDIARSLLPITSSP